MNDFTKEELKFIYDWLNWISKEDYPVKNKIQSMIDNYCDHSQYIYYGDIPVGECTKCHMVMIP